MKSLISQDCIVSVLVSVSAFSGDHRALAKDADSTVPSVTDVCSIHAQNSCSDELASGNWISVMNCTKNMFNNLVQGEDGAACVAQMKNSLALVCTDDIQLHCTGSSFEDLKDCVEDEMEHFSVPCQVRIMMFKDELDDAQDRLLEIDDDEVQTSVDPSKSEQFQFLWNGAIVSDPDSSKWKKIWHHGRWWFGGLVLLILLSVLFLVRRKRRLARAQLQEGDTQPEANRSPSNWQQRIRSFLPSRFGSKPEPSFTTAPSPYTTLQHEHAAPVTVEYAQNIPVASYAV